MSEERARLGVIGGSGLYEIEGLEGSRELSIETPFGAPSDSLVLGRLGEVHGRRLLFSRAMAAAIVSFRRSSTIARTSGR